MIFVDRTVAPDILTNRTLKGCGPGETERAIAFYAKRNNRKKSFHFKVYSHDSVKSALEQMFKGKCAYCESQYTAVMPGDVEHWRPKGEVEGGRKLKLRPGYYWLAADWDNLLPSCIDCNRRRYQKVSSGNKRLLLGKQNSFPLEVGSRRAKKPGDHTNERPLLLHPCKDAPENFFAFAEEEDSRGIIRAKTDSVGEPLSQAKVSIEVYALHRTELVLARKKRYIEIQEQIVRVKEAMVRLNEAQAPEIRTREDLTLRRELTKLNQFCDSDQAYSLLARQIVNKFLASVV